MANNNKHFSLIYNQNSFTQKLISSSNILKNYLYFPNKFFNGFLHTFFSTFLSKDKSILSIQERIGDVGMTLDWI